MDMNYRIDADIDIVLTFQRERCLEWTWYTILVPSSTSTLKTSSSPSTMQHTRTTYDIIDSCDTTQPQNPSSDPIRPRWVLAAVCRTKHVSGRANITIDDIQHAFSYLTPGSLCSNPLSPNLIPTTSLFLSNLKVRQGWLAFQLDFWLGRKHSICRRSKSPINFFCKACYVRCGAWRSAIRICDPTLFIHHPLRIRERFQCPSWRWQSSMRDPLHQRSA